jgi:transposase
VQRIFSLLTIPHPKLLPTALGIDEFKGNTNREKYQCILTDLDSGEIFDILPTRKKSDLIAYFSQFTNRNDVKFYVMDMTNNYKSLAYLFPNAEVIVDRFHYVRQVYWALDAVRKDVQKSFISGKRIYFKHSKKLLFKDYKDLSDENKQALRIMLSQSEKLHTAWQLKEDFKYFREAETQEQAERELHIWIQEAQESNLVEFEAATKALHNWFRYIINSVVYKYSNGITEGFNNKIKVLKRNAYGFHDFDNFKKRILLNCEKHGNQAQA